MNVFMVLQLFVCQIGNCGGGFVIIFIIFFLNIIKFIIIFIVIITIIIIIIIMFPATDAGQNMYSYSHLTYLVLIVNGKYNVQISIMNILIGTKIFKN